MYNQTKSQSSVKQTIGAVLKKMDRASPRPLLYSFRMTKDEKALFDAAIRQSRTYLEFGMGGSTFRALLKSKAVVYSVDSSVEWIERMRSYAFIRRCEKTRLSLFYVNIGATKKWGLPVDEAERNLFPAYSTAVFDSINKQAIDTVLIDGRFRVACTLKTILECHSNPKLQILIHDFSIRPHYHPVLKYLDETAHADTFFVFTLKKGIDLNAVREEYEHYKYDPL